MDNQNKFKQSGFDWHPDRHWKRRYFNDLKKVFYG